MVDLRRQRAAQRSLVAREACSAVMPSSVSNSDVPRSRKMPWTRSDVSVSRPNKVRVNRSTGILLGHLRFSHCGKKSRYLITHYNMRVT